MGKRRYYEDSDGKRYYEEDDYNLKDFFIDLFFKIVISIIWVFVVAYYTGYYDLLMSYVWPFIGPAVNKGKELLASFLLFIGKLMV